MLNEKGTITFLISEYFPKPNFLEANVKVELDFSTYATKEDTKNAIVVDKIFLLMRQKQIQKTQ